MLDHSVSSRKDISSEGTAVAAVQDVLRQTPSILLPHNLLGFFFCPLHSYRRAPLKCISHNLDQRLVCVHRSAFMLDVIRSRASLRQVPIRASAVSFLLCDEALKISAVYFRGRAEEAYCTQGHHLFYITCEKIIVQFCVCVCVQFILYGSRH